MVGDLGLNAKPLVATSLYDAAARDMLDWLLSMCTVLKLGSTGLRLSNTTFTLTQCL
jgi:hypothetical protein